MSKILITGAAGFIGSQIAYSLWKDGNEVLLVDDFSFGKIENLRFEKKDFGNSILPYNICDKNVIDKLFEREQFDFVYHMAAVSQLPECQDDPQKAIEINVLGTINILEASRLYGVKKIIFASTSAVYENSKTFPSDEKEIVYPSLIYPNTKFVAEQFCRSYCEVYRMNISCLRFSNVYGPRMDCTRKQPSVIAYIIHEMYHNRSPILHSNGEQKRDFIYIDDVIKLAKVAQSGVGFDIVNVSSNQAYSINELYAMIANIMQRETVKPLYVKSNKFWMQYEGLRAGEYAISDIAIEKEVNKYTLLNNNYAREKYGWVPQTSIYIGLENTVCFYLNQNQKE